MTCWPGAGVVVVVDVGGVVVVVGAVVVEVLGVATTVVVDVLVVVSGTVVDGDDVVDVALTVVDVVELVGAGAGAGAHPTATTATATATVATSEAPLRTCPLTTPPRVRLTGQPYAHDRRSSSRSRTTHCRN